jgi:hypothetical protein
MVSSTKSVDFKPWPPPLCVGMERLLLQCKLDVGGEMKWPKQILEFEIEHTKQSWEMN